MADVPDYTQNTPPAEADEESVSSHDLVVSDLRNWRAPTLTASTETMFASRKRYGHDKYGQILHRDNDRDMGKDAEDEFADGAAYLRTWIDADPDLVFVLEPLYREALWIATVVHRLRQGEEVPSQFMKMQGPLTSLDEERQRHPEPTMDDGHACRVPPGEIFTDEWITCGTLQRDKQMCVRTLQEHPDGYGWCPRHGLRTEPNEKADERARCQRCELPIERHGQEWKHSFVLPDTTACPVAVPPSEKAAP